MDLTKQDVIQRVKEFECLGLSPEQKYPGVTRILGGTKDMTGLIAWRNRVGDEEADRILKESQSIGTSLDKLVMKCFESDFNQDDHKDEPGFDLYRQLKAPLKKVEPISLQLKVWSDKLKVMGYLDILGFYDGDLTLMDVKNTKTTKNREYVEDYFLQCTLYSLMLYDLLGIEVKQIALLMADRSSTVPQIFVERTSKYVREAVRRVNAYYRQLESNPLSV